MCVCVHVVSVHFFTFHQQCDAPMRLMIYAVHRAVVVREGLILRASFRSLASGGCVCGSLWHPHFRSTDPFSSIVLVSLPPWRRQPQHLDTKVNTHGSNTRTTTTFSFCSSWPSSLVRCCIRGRYSRTNRSAGQLVSHFLTHTSCAFCTVTSQRDGKSTTPTSTSELPRSRRIE